MTTSLHIDEVRSSLDTWFAQVKRAFPWRESPTPYAVFVSEVMLQQTQASRVLHYFSRWMKLFPSLESLSQASEEEVMKAWEGLGYYRRARALHKAAQILVKEHRGILPQDKDVLLRIPGIGPYTAGAILSFAFHKRAPAIDANVERVIRRLCNISYSNPLSKLSVQACVEDLLPQKNAWHTMEGLIELGALLCNKKPICTACPLSPYCHAILHNNFEEPLPKAKVTQLYRDVACITAEESFLIIQRKGKEVMSGLYEFPYFDSLPGGRSGEEFLKLLRETYTLHLSLGKKLAKVIHTFTHFRSHLHPWLLISTKKFAFEDGVWEPLEKLSSLPFSSGHKKIFSQIIT